ncbi:MAG: CRISPR-associated endoribonuclease Cas6 [Salinivirgaceae bacterium]
MRIRLTIELNNTPQLLPLNYKYPVSSWIYKVLGTADTDFAHMLHENGYRTSEGKRFKLFTFSDLVVPKGQWIIQGDRMEIRSPNINLTLSFQLPIQTEKFISGLFLNQKFIAGDARSKVQGKVSRVELEEPPEWHDGWNRFTTLSPIIIAKTSSDRPHPQYLEPVHEDYSHLLARNLIEKYKALCLQTNQQAHLINESAIDFKLMSPKFKSSLQTIKANRENETKIKAYRYQFALKAPKEILSLAYYAGFGAENAQGFGCCEWLGPLLPVSATKKHPQENSGI